MSGAYLENLIAAAAIGLVVGLLSMVGVQRMSGATRQRGKSTKDKMRRRFVDEKTTDRLANSVLQTEISKRAAVKEIERAGIRMSVEELLATRILSAGLGVVFAIAIIMRRGSDPKYVGLGILFTTLGFMLPQLYLYSERRKWQDSVEAQLPGALDLMNVSVSAGVSFDEAIRNVVESTDGELSDALGNVLVAAQFTSTTAALKHLADNAGVESLTLFAASLDQAQRNGIPIASILSQQAETVRLYRRQKLEAEINKLPVKLIIPIVFLIFPCYIAVLLVPAAMQVVQSMAAM